MSVDSKMTAIADAIREKTGGTAKLTLGQMATEISGITGLDSDIKEFTQMNDLVTAYLAAADAQYTDSNGDTVSVMANYQTSTGDKDRPLGFATGATSGNCYLQNEESGEGWLLPVVANATDNIYNAIPGKVSQYLVKNSDGTLSKNGRIKPTGKVRMIRFYGYVRNCRDLGGWACDGGTVNYGKLFRSAVPESQETWIDPKIAKSVGIRHQIDFRDDAEAGYITESCLGANVRYERITLGLYYKDIIDMENTDYENAKKVFRKIIDSVIHDEPVLYNCSLGRDRTGTVTFMILALLGVARADIDKDYELSSFSPVGDPCARTRSDYQALGTYLGTFGKTTLRDNVVMWLLKSGFTMEEINAYRKAMVNGTPAVLDAADYTIMYSITSNLTGCTISNSATSLAEGAPYSATLALTGGNNQFKSVTVKMGGTDITSTAYSDGAINIPSITGNVVITAVAEYAAAYTNQIPKSIDTDGNPYNGGKGWKTGWRLNSSGVESESAGFEVTGFMEATAGDVIRFKNLTSTDTSSNTRIFFYTSAFVKNNTPLSGQSLIDLFTAGQYTVDSLYADCKYFRISANSISDDSIVTVNEPID